MPKISIIVPVYNVQQYIDKCLESLVNQTFKDIEIIIVDDGSPDESYKIYEKYAGQDNRIKIIKKKNAGVSEARNTGIENATGDFLMFVDSDDWMELDGCQILFDAYIKSNADTIVSDAYTITDGVKRQNHVFDKDFISDDPSFIKAYQAACIGYGYNPRPYPSDPYNVSGLGSPWNKLYNRRIIIENGLKYDSYVKGIYDDNLFTLHYLNHVKKICYVAKPVYDYRIISSSLTQSYKENTLDISRRIFEKIQEFIKGTGDPDYFSKPFAMYVIRRLSAELGVYYFSPKNPTQRKIVFQELESNIEKEPYSSAFEIAESKRMMISHRTTYFLAKKKQITLLWLSFKSRRFLKKLLKK